MKISSQENDELIPHKISEAGNIKVLGNINILGENFNATESNCVDQILSTGILYNVHQRIIFLVNNDMKIKYPAIYYNVDSNLKLYDRTPGLFIIAGNITKILETIYKNTTEIHKCDFIISVPALDKSLFQLLEKYFVKNATLLLKNTYTSKESLDTELYDVKPLNICSHLNHRILQVFLRVDLYKALKVLSPIVPPFVINSQNGIHTEIINVIAKNMNLTIRCDINGSNGVLDHKAFRAGKYDLYAGTINSYDLEAHMFEHTVFVTYDYLIYAFPKIVQINWLKIVHKEFTISVWLCFFGLVLLLYILFVLFERVLPNNKTKSSIALSLLRVLLEGTTDIFTTHVSLKILSITFILFGMLFTTAYKTKMFDIMTGDFTYHLYHEWDDIMKNKLKIGITDASLTKYYKQASKKAFSTIKNNNLFEVCNEMLDCLNVTATKKSTVIPLTSRSFYYYVPDHFLDSDGKPMFDIIYPKIVNLMYFTLGFKKGHPHFNSFNRKLQHFKEGGLIYVLYRKYSSKYKKAAALAEYKASIDSTILTLQSFQTAFIMYLIELVDDNIIKVFKSYSIQNAIMVTNIVNISTENVLTKEQPVKELYTVKFLKMCLTYGTKVLKISLQKKSFTNMKILCSLSAPYVISTEEGIHIDIIKIIAKNLKIKPVFYKTDLPSHSTRVVEEFNSRNYDLYATPTAIMNPDKYFYTLSDVPSKVLEKCVDQILSVKFSKNDRIYIVNTDLKISYPAINYNTDKQLNCFTTTLTLPDMYIISELLDDNMIKVFKSYSIQNAIMVTNIVNISTQNFLTKEKPVEELYTVKFLKMCLTYGTKVLKVSLKKKSVTNMKILCALSAPYVISTEEGIHIDIIKIIAKNLNIKPAFYKTDLPGHSTRVVEEFNSRSYDLYATPTAIMYPDKYFYTLITTISASGSKQQKNEPVVLEPFPDGSYVSYSHFDENSVGGHGHGGGDYDTGKGTGAELASLAHSSAVQANNAVQNQHTAGSQAAFGIKSSLASAAYGAAQAAQAALVGKQALAGSIKRQLAEAQQQLQGEIAQYQQTQATAQAAENTAHQAQAQLSALTAAVTAAQAGAQQASQAAGEAAQAAAAQHAMVVEAKQRISQLSAQLQNCLADLHQTEAAAQKAAAAAHLAQSNAAAAGAAAAGHGGKGGYGGFGSDYHH
ncbi:unnamed protein product [Diabrotica balteata]|uniref:Uncharacterized protein n=1 Tax=Diabrotica balteata TaxID=107213 RepID=A0A9N9XBZ1_DIABA|nr:unnamed protein product [Diabrotica balteata]